MQLSPLRISSSSGRLSFSVGASEVILFSGFMKIILIFIMNSVSYCVSFFRLSLLIIMNRQFVQTHLEDSQKYFFGAIVQQVLVIFAVVFFG